MQTGDVALADIGLLDSAPEPAFDFITDIVRDLLRAPIALVSIVDPARGRQFLKAARGLSEPWATKRQTPLSHSFCKHVTATGRPLIVDDARRHLHLRGNGAIADLGVVAYLGAPLIGVGGAPIGALCAIDSVERRWTSTDVDQIRKLARIATDQIQLRAALASRQSQLTALNAKMGAESDARRRAEAELQKHATTDPLTGALTRRAFQDLVEKEIARIRRSGEDAALVLVGLDGFKLINETHGRDAGDELLRGVFERLSRSARHQVDGLARYGGDQFIMLLPSTNAAEAMAPSERHRGALAAAPFLVAGGAEISVTASFGLAQLRGGALDFETALHKAGEALAQAKRQGGDCVVHAHPQGHLREVIGPVSVSA